MENSNKLKSNENYSLAELFLNAYRKIIIPDFQRDYCWGDKTHGEKKNSDIISSFLDTLIEESKDNSEILLGKIDVYEHLKNIYLSDGQQRLTSLYLLMGMLYRIEQSDEVKSKIKSCLISDAEDSFDQKEPNLQYAIRESTIFFLRDLVNEFFLSTNPNNQEVEDIKNQPYYFSDYNLDPSIISMISSLKVMEQKLKVIDQKSNFSGFIINRVKIQYYDVEGKEHGEERFVIINTTGKSLTNTENVKPILLAKMVDNKYAKEWEDRETYFWQYRKDEELIADKGVDDFLTWCFQIEDKIENVEINKNSKKKLKDGKNEEFLIAIQKHFDSLKKILEYLQDEKFQKQFKFLNSEKEVKTLLNLRELSNEKVTNVLIPFLSYLTKFKDDKESAYQFLRRLRKNYFYNKWENRKKTYIDWRYVLQIIEKVNKPEDCIYFTNDYNKIDKVEIPKAKWFNEEEEKKIYLKEKYKSEIEEWEDYEDFMGDLSPIFEVTESINFYDLKSFYKTYKCINIDKFTYSEDIKLKNLYSLILYLRSDNWEARSIGGSGYLMLNSSKKLLFNQDRFNEYWIAFENKDIDVHSILYSHLKSIFKDILKENTLEEIIKDSKKIGHHERIKLWAILEFLLCADKEIDFKKSIAQYWDYPNLIEIKVEGESDENDYQIGNLLLGTSYYNNKTGNFIYDSYPLMKQLSEKRKELTNADIKNQSEVYYQALKTLI